MPTTTVVIPNYNGMKFLPACMESLKNQDYKDFEILMIDNASADESVSWMEEHYPEVPLVKNETNLGFSGAVNQGIELAKTPYVILLNNDVEVDPGYVGAMVRAMESDPKIFSVSAKMIRFYERELMDDAGDLMNLIGWAFQRGIARDVKLYEKDMVPVFSACAGAAIYRKEVFDRIGTFDLMHFAYLEDLDVGYRARLYGYKNVYCSKAIVYHVGSGTSADGNKYSDFKVKTAARNSIYVLYKNMPLLQRLFNLVPLTLGYLLKLSFFKKRGFGTAYREGLKEGLAHRKECKKVPFSLGRIPYYFVIEWMLFTGMITYTWEYLHRKHSKSNSW